MNFFASLAENKCYQFNCDIFARQKKDEIMLSILLLAGIFYLIIKLITAGYGRKK